jgi:hypothetical protein
MKRIVLVTSILFLLTGCFNQPLGFHLKEPGGYNFTTGNQRDIHTYERYANGQVAVKITLKMIELSGPIYDPVFDVKAFLNRIGWQEVTVSEAPVTIIHNDLPLIRITVIREDETITLWVINLDSPTDLWAEVTGDADAVNQAFEDWLNTWETLDYLYV